MEDLAADQPALSLPTNKPAAFPEMRWVPRKRLNTRWPIEPRPTKDAALCPPVKFEVPATISAAKTGHSPSHTGATNASAEQEAVSTYQGDDIWRWKWKPRGGAPYRREYRISVAN